MIYPENIEEIRKFADENGVDEKYLLGEKYSYGMIFNSRQMPENIVFNVKTLWLFRLVKVPANTVFNVDGTLRLDSVESIHSSVKFVNFERLVLPKDKKVKIIW